jgi:sulfur carrier protein
MEGDMDVTVNGAVHQVEACGSLADLVRALGLEGKRIAVERNGEIVPRSAYAVTPVAALDRLEIVAAVGGG